MMYLNQNFVFIFYFTKYTTSILYLIPDDLAQIG